MKQLLYIFFLANGLFGGQILPKDFSSLKVNMPQFDPLLIDIHLKLYEGYVSSVNYIDSMISKTIDPFLLQSLRKQYGFEYDGMILHELYFSQLGADGKINKGELILEKIQTSFVSFEIFKSTVLSYAKTRGIGWVILFAAVETGELKLSWVADHEKGLLAGFIPIFVIDLWEHAYISQFGLNKDKYIDLLFQYMDWSVINSRYIQNCKSLKNSYKEIKKAK